MEDSKPIKASDTKRVRLALGLTQEQFRRKLGLCTVVTISRWENGHTQHVAYYHEAAVREAAVQAGVRL